MKAFVVITLFFLFTSISVSGESSGVGTIKQLYVKTQGTFVRIVFSNTAINPDNCERADYYIVELDGGIGGSRFLSTLLTAYKANKTIQFWVTGCTRGKYWGYAKPTVNDIYLY